MYIIKDVDENIKTDLLVKSNIKSPPFFYKKIIFKPLTNLLVKEAVSPFNFLINFLGQALTIRKISLLTSTGQISHWNNFCWSIHWPLLGKQNWKWLLNCNHLTLLYQLKNEISKRKYLLIPVIKNRKTIYSLKFLKKKVRINIYANRFVGNL